MKLYPPWSEGRNNPATERGIVFTVPEVDNLPDLHGDPASARLVLYIGGNYYFLLAPLVSAFVERHPELRGKVFYETLPPGVLLQQMEHGGVITFGNCTLRAQPDVFQAGQSQIERMVERDQLQGPGAAFMHNSLGLMASAQGTSRLRSLADLGEPGVRLAMPNPETEGIAREARQAMIKAGGERLAQIVYDEKVRSGEVILTQIHHRQTPLFIMQGKAEGGVTYITEALFQERIGNPIRAVPITPEHNVRATVSAAVVKGAPHPDEAWMWLEFLSSSTAQETMSEYGFEPADSGGEAASRGDRGPQESAKRQKRNPADDVEYIRTVEDDRDLAHTPDGAVKVVYNFDYLEPARFAATMNNLRALMRHYREHQRPLALALVFHHHGINFLMRDYRRGTERQPYAARDGFTNHGYFQGELQGLVDQGAAVRVCHNTMESLGLGAEDLWGFAQPIASGFVWVAELQSSYGYGYAKTSG